MGYWKWLYDSLIHFPREIRDILLAVIIIFVGICGGVYIAEFGYPWFAVIWIFSSLFFGVTWIFYSLEIDC